jgi:hypothetical protein
MRDFKTAEIKVEIISALQELYLHDCKTQMLKKNILSSSSSALSNFYARLPPTSDTSTPIALRDISRDIMKLYKELCHLFVTLISIFILSFTLFLAELN